MIHLLIEIYHTLQVNPTSIIYLMYFALILQVISMKSFAKKFSTRIGFYNL